VNKNEVFVTGYAKLPKGITAAELYSIIAVGMLVDRDTGVINEVDCTLATVIGKNVVKSLVIGQNINDLVAIEAQFNRQYYGSAKKALISAIRTCNEKFRQMVMDTAQ